MEVQFYGANCIRVTTKKSEVVIDDNLSKYGKKSISRPDDVVLFTRVAGNELPESSKLTINQPGEYEAGDVLIQGIAARAYGDEPKTYNATLFKLESDDVSLVVVGHAYPELSDEQLEALGQVDVLLIPVGNNEVTLSGSDALKLIKKVEPSIIIPTHYSLDGINYSAPQASLEDALKELAMEPSETLAKLKLKAGSFPEDDITKLVVLEVSK